jgi:hypothetical protein
MFTNSAITNSGDGGPRRLIRISANHMQEAGATAAHRGGLMPCRRD